jgi:transposase
MPRRPYPSDLTDGQWAVLAPLVPAPKPGGRPARHDRRELVDAILYVLRTGCQWRALPHEYPPWSTAYWWFRRWRLDGTWERVNAALRRRVRAKAGRDPEPSAAVLDSQSVKTTEKGGPGATTAARR